MGVLLKHYSVGGGEGEMGGLRLSALLMLGVIRGGGHRRETWAGRGCKGDTGDGF